MASTSSVFAQAPLRKIAELDLRLLGISATVDPANPVVPKNTPSAVRIVVRAGAGELSAADVARFVGAGFSVQAELSGPGLRQTITLPHLEPGDTLPADPLLLPLPGLTVGGDYTLSNIRIVAGGRAALDVTPDLVTLKVIDQILVTSVKTRPLTLDEIRGKGIVLDRDDYLGFEFTMGLKLDSKVVNLNFPVVFDRQGVVVPLPVDLSPQDPRRTVTAPQLPGGGGTIMPLLLTPDGGGGAPQVPLTLPNGEPVRIPSVLVIPGNVGYLKQFFSAQLFVANGAPLGSGLVVTGVTGTLKLPPGADLEPGTQDDPLALPELFRDSQRIEQPPTMAVLGVGADGTPATTDDVSSLAPAEMGQAEFLIRGEKEGFHQIDFDIRATLEGLPVGPVTVAGKASGGVLVRNPFFDVTFTVPSVVRKGETFKLFATVNNIGQGDANLVHMTLDSSRMSGVRLLGEGTRSIDTIRAGDARTLEFQFESLKTGQVTASYLRFDPEGGPENVTGHINFTLGVGERGVPLSPDTLVLPASVDLLPSSLVDAAMRVLGQGWSIANAPPNSLPRGVLPTTKVVVTQKALAFAEAGLRTTLGQPVADAIRDLAFDFYGGSPLDPGFDQLLRQTDAGRGFALALGAELAGPVTDAGGIVDYERELARLAASGPDFISLAVTGPSEVAVTDGLGRRTSTSRSGPDLPASQVPGAVLIPAGPPSTAPLLGLLASTIASPYTVELSGPAALAVTLPRGDGTFLRGTASVGARARLVLDLARPDALSLAEDADSDGVYETPRDVVREVLSPEGPRLLTATIIGPETFDRASEFGLNVVFLFDRIVEEASSAVVDHYAIPANAVRAAKRQLTGRLVFATLAQPEGPYLPTTATVTGVVDSRGVAGPPATLGLVSRLEGIGGVVSGRVVNADGTPLTSGTLIYSNQSDGACPGGGSFPALSAIELSADGRYEVRYVRQNACGLPFKVSIQDPFTTNFREVLAAVHRPGEQLVLDLALVGRGAVAGTVFDLAGRPVPGALVSAVSATDPNRGGNGETDGDGRYRIDGLTVGQIAVKAGKGTGLGRSSGRIDRAGTTATINVTLDGGAVRVSGRFLKVDAGVVTPVHGALLSYVVSGQPAGYALTEADGSYIFDAMPVGHFRISTANASVEGDASAGDNLTGRDLVWEVQAPAELGTARGVVRLPDGSPAPGVIVARDVSGQFLEGVITGPQGQFELGQLRVGEAFSLGAVTRDRLRSGSARLTIDPITKVAEGIVITLSGIGTAEFTVLDPAGRPLANLEVALVGGCGSPCGCNARQSGGDGRVRFEGFPLGAVTAQVIRQNPGYTDVARASVSIARDGATAFGILRFSGAGVVTGVVEPPDGVELTGGEVALTSQVFRNDGVFTCGLVSDVSHRAQIDPNTNRFRFTGVNVGPVSVIATNPFSSTSVGTAGTLTSDGQELELRLKFVDTTAGELSGTVFLPDGVTPAGAGVEVTANGALPDVTVSTGAQGEYRFAKIFPQGSYSLTARDPVTGGVAREYLFLRAGQDLEHELRLKGRGTVRVRVVDGADQPVASAFVRVQELDFPSRSYEAAIEPADEGSAILEEVLEGPFSVEVSDGFGRGGRASGVLPKAGDTVEVKVRLTVTGTVRGRFLLPGGATPIPFGVVTLIAGGRVVGQQTTPGTGEVGAFSFDYVPAGSVRVEAQDPLTLRTGFAVGTLESQDQVLAIDVVAQGLGTVEGLITSRRGGGEPEVERGAHVDIFSGSFRACTLSDATGRYLIEGVPEGHVVVSASLVGGAFAGTASGSLTGDGTHLTLDVALRDSGTVRGQVLAANGVTPASISTVTIEVGGSGGSRQSAVTDADGRFVFDRIPAGHANLTVDRLNSIDRARTSFEVPAGAIDVQVMLNGVGSIQGRTLASDGTPLAGALTIQGTGAISYWFQVEVGDNGIFGLPEVLAGPFTASLRARSGEFTLYGTAADTVADAVVTHLDVQVQPSGTVTGVVLRADGVTPAYGTDVTVALDPNRGAVTLQATSDGRFTARGVPLGPFSLRLRDPLTAGVGLLAGQAVETNGQAVDVGSIVLDDSAISVVSVDPPDAAPGIAVTRPIQVTFTDKLGSPYGASVQTETGAGVGFIPSLSGDGKTLILQPYPTWPDSRELTLTLTTGVTDVFGRHLTPPVTSRFRTVDLSPPQVTLVAPANGAIQVASDATIAVTFSEALSEATDLTDLVVLTGPLGPIAGTAALSSTTTAAFTPGAPLAANLAYSVVVNGAIDLSGNQQTVPFTSTFQSVDTIAPTVVQSTPAPGAWTNVARPSILVSLSDALSGIDAAASTLSLDGLAVAPVRTASYIQFTPDADLADGTHAIAATATDRGGNVGALGGSFGVDRVAPSAATVTGVTDGQLLRGIVHLGGSATDATSGLAKVELLRDGFVFLTVTPPAFDAAYNTAGLSEGPHALAARATDLAGNVGPVGPAVPVVVDNQTLTLVVTAPTPNTRVRDSVLVKATASEPIERMEFSAASATVTDTSAPFEATLDVAGAAEGSVVITVRAFGTSGDSASATVPVLVDRTAPAAPDASRITAEETGNGFSGVYGLGGAVEGNVTVEVVNTATSAQATVLAAGDGSFATQLLATLDTVLSVVAVDSVGNRSIAIEVTVVRNRTPGGVPLTGMLLWVSGDLGVTKDDNGLVTSWTDQSAKHNNLFQTTAASRPLLVPGGFNGRDVLHFDGNDSVNFTDRLTTIRSVFWVVKEDEAATPAYRFLLGDDTTRDFHGGYGAPGPIWWGAGYENYQNVINGQTWLNGVPVTGTSTPRPRTMSVVSLITTGNVRGNNFGRAYTQSNWWGDLAELIVYERPLSSVERQAVEDYLIGKYRPFVPPASTPAILPSGGVFNGSTTVTLSTNTPEASIHYTLDGSEPSSSSPSYSGAFVLAETTTVKAKAFSTGYEPSATATATFMRDDESPPVDGMKLWLRADAGIATNGGGWVTDWADQSGSGNHALQFNGTQAPQLIPDALNGLPTLRFDGNDSVSFTSRLTTIRTVFWVVKEDEAATSAYRFLLGDDTTRDFHGGYGAPGPIWWGSGYENYQFVINGQTWLNGAPVTGTATPRPRTMSVVSLVTTGNVRANNFGRAYTQSNWWGDLAELIVYDRPLNVTERKAVEDYLLVKYQLGGSVSAPIISPNGGTFTDSVTVSLSNPTPRAELYYTTDGSEPTTTSTPYTEPIVLTTTTTLKAKAFRSDLPPSVTVTAGFTNEAEFSPRSVGGLRLWLRADAGLPSGYGDFWFDQSGQDNHAFQLAGTSIPAVVPNQLNGLPVVHFDGNDSVSFTSRLATIRTVFWVVREDPAATPAYRFLLGDDTTRDFHGGHGAPGPIWWGSGYENYQNVINGQTWLNGVPVTGTSTLRPRTMSVISLVTTGDVRGNNFGRAYTQSNWWGDLAELIIYDRPLSGTERKAVEDYLLVKYQLGGTVTAPLVSPNGGVFTGSTSVSMSTSTPGAAVHYTTDGTEPTTSSASYTGPIVLMGTTTLKAKAFRSDLPPSITVTAGFTNDAEFNPRTLSGLQLWLRADAGVPSGYGDLWADQSGNDNHGSQFFGTAIPRVVPNFVSGLPVLHFDGSDSVSFANRLSTIRTVFWVVREDPAATAAYRFLLGDDTTRDFHGGHGAPGPIWWGSGYENYQFVINGQTFLNGLPVNGVTTLRPRTMSLISLVTTGSVRANNFGRAYTQSNWWGDLAELVVYDRALSDTERRSVEDYLNARYHLFLR